MRRIDIIILAVGLSAAIAWAILSGRDGYKGSNAMIVARSISITSTINGQVDNDPPEVGSLVGPADLLITIRNRRFDLELGSEISFLEDEIESARQQQQQLDELLLFYQEKADAHEKWMLRDVELGTAEDRHRLAIANRQNELKKLQAQRMADLYRDKHTSAATMDLARIEAEIAAAEVELGRRSLQRNQWLYRSLQENGMFFDNGDASYWDKMVDTVTFRQFDNLSRLSTLTAQLTRVRTQSNDEHSTSGSSVTEDHHAPFSGMVSATYVAQGTRVTTGTNLLQVLDCTDPIVIVPLPEHRIGEFDVGMRATIYPLDSDDVLPGVVEYISSGPQIGNDQSLFVQEQLTTSGVHAVVGFSGSNYRDAIQGCESAHRAVVVIHNQGGFALGSPALAETLPN